MGFFAEVKALWEARKVVKAAVKEGTVDGQVKPGWMTTEFWTKNIVQLVVLYNAFEKKNVDPQMAVGIVTGLEGIYTLGRTVVKSVKDFVAAIKAK